MGRPGCRNIGQCQRYLGKHKEALFSYKTYLVRVPNPPNRDLVERLIQETERRVEQTTAQKRKPPRSTKHGRSDPAAG